MIPLLDRLTTLVDLYREDPGVLGAMPTVNPVSGHPEQQVLWGLVELSARLREPTPPGKTAELGLALILRLAALTGQSPEDEPSRANLARLAGLQTERLTGFRGPDTWRSRPAVFHIERAFSQLVALSRHAEGKYDGRPDIERLGTIADLANYVTFAMATAGVLEGAPRSSEARGGGFGVVS